MKQIFRSYFFIGLDNMRAKKINFIFSVGLAVVGCFFAFHVANASQLFLYPQEYDVTPDQKLIVDVRLDAKLDTINVVKIKLHYPADLLKVEDVSTRGSFLSLFAENPKVDATTGEITLTGGIPHGTYVVGGKVATITFDPIVPGTAKVTLDQTYSSVLKNDGKGTPTTLSVQDGTYHIVEVISGAIEVTSPTHPSEDVWYPKTAVILQWTPEKNAAYSFLITTNPFENPDSVPDQFTGSVSYSDIDDGVHYFIVSQIQTDGTWKIVGRRRILIDTTAPSPIQYAVGKDTSVYGGKYFLAFSSSDAASGIARFEIQEGNHVVPSISSPYVLQDQHLRSTLILRAFDFAGNQTEVVIRVGDTSVWWWYVGIILGIVLLGGMLRIWLIVKSRRKKKQEKNEPQHISL